MGGCFVMIGMRLGLDCDFVSCGCEEFRGKGGGLVVRSKQDNNVNTTLGMGGFWRGMDRLRFDISGGFRGPLRPAIIG
jgi:hypothetical protein